MRRQPLHFVHSKVMCWAAVDRGLAVVEHAGVEAPVARWQAARDELRAGIEKAHGVKAFYDGADMTRPNTIESMMRKRARTALALFRAKG